MHVHAFKLEITTAIVITIVIAVVIAMTNFIFFIIKFSSVLQVAPMIF